MLFHLSIDKNLTCLSVRVPACCLSDREDTITKRVCFSDNIKGCLSALQQSDPFFYVYTPINLDEKYLYKPNSKQVPDCERTNETWYLKDVEVEFVGIIKISGIDSFNRYTNSNGRETTFFNYNYKWGCIVKKYEYLLKEAS